MNGEEEIRDLYRQLCLKSIYKKWWAGSCVLCVATFFDLALDNVSEYIHNLF